MSRALLLTAALFAGLCAVSILPAAAAKKPLPAGVKNKLNQRMPIAASARAAAAVSGSSRNNNVFTCFFDEAIFIDLDGDEELSRGDSIIANGAMMDRFGRKLGTWEGTLVDSSELTFTFNITLRFVNDGTVVINGAPYPDGTRSRAFIAPIVGTTGRMIKRSGAALGFDDDDNLVVILGAR